MFRVQTNFKSSVYDTMSGLLSIWQVQKQKHPIQVTQK